MGTTNSELLAQLQAAVSGWTAEVGSSQQRLSQKIDGANEQLDRLLTVLQERNDHAVALAEATEELERLKRSTQQDDMPPGTVTNYVPEPPPRIEAVRQELNTTFERLHGAVQSWTAEVTETQRGLAEQFAASNSQLNRLLTVLAPSSADDAAVPALQIELEQVRLERDALKSEVEALRSEQATFTTTHLDAETTREANLRQEIDALQQALVERDSIIDEGQTLLAESQQIEAALNTEIADLERQVAVYVQSETQLREAVDQQRKESEQHIHALTALSQEIEALRKALSTEADATENDVTKADVDSGALAAAQARIEALEATIAALEAAESSETSQEINEALQAQVDELETRPTQEELEAARARISELEATAAAFEENRNTNEALQARIVELETRPTQEELEAARTRISELEVERDASVEPDSEGGVSVSEEERDAELEALRAQITEFEARKSQFAEMNDASSVTRRGNENSGDGADQADAAAPTAIPTEEREAFESALAQLEAELATLQQREEESVATARTLLQELETHREFEAAQEEAVTTARKEAEELREALEETTQQLREAQETLDRLQAESEVKLPPGDAVSEESPASSEADESALRNDIEALQATMVAQEKQIAELGTAVEEATSLRAELESLQTAAQEEAARSAEALAQANEQVAALKQQQTVFTDAPAGGDNTALLERQSAELREYRETQQTAEKWIDDLEKQLVASEATITELRTVHETLESRYDAFTEELDALRNLESTRSTALDEARAETEIAEAQIREHEAIIARLQEELAEKNTALASITAVQDVDTANQGVQQTMLDELKEEVTRLEVALVEQNAALEETVAAHTEAERSLESTRNRESELLQERDEIATALHEISAKNAAQEEDLSKAISTLESQQLELRERDEQIEALRYDVGEMRSQLELLAEEESTAKKQADELKNTLSEIQASDALHTEDLEQSQVILEQLRTEHQQQQETVEQLSSRGDELEHLLNAARDDEVFTLATVEELQGELAALQEREAMEAKALEENQALVATLREGLVEREERVAQLEAQHAEVLVEKEVLSQTTATQEAEMQATMAQVSEAITERDELRDALEKSNDEKERIYVGEAGAGLSAMEAAASLEQRTRQQDIVLSELTHGEESRCLGDILVDADIITPEQLADALEIQSQDPSQLLGTILISKDYTTDDAIAQAVACQLGKNVVNPTELHVQPQAIELLNKDICTWHVCLPLRVTEERLVVVMANPLDESAIQKICDVSQREITPVVGAASQIMNAIENHYGTF